MGFFNFFKQGQGNKSAKEHMEFWVPFGLIGSEISDKLGDQIKTDIDNWFYQKQADYYTALPAADGSHRG